MRLLRLSEVEIGPNDRVFRHPRMRALIMWLAVLCGAAAMLCYALTGKWKLGYIFGAAILPFLLLTLRFVTARFHPSNWLLRASATGLSVQYRSYLNYQLPADEPSVAFISYREIASARLVPRARPNARSLARWRHSNATSAIHRTGIVWRHRAAGERFAGGAVT